jgi:hypothetical protein
MLPGLHQGIGQSVPGTEGDASRATMINVDSERIRRKPVLGGLINEYTHAASAWKTCKSPSESHFRAGR